MVNIILYVQMYIFMPICTWENTYKLLESSDGIIILNKCMLLHFWNCVFYISVNKCSSDTVFKFLLIKNKMLGFSLFIGFSWESHLLASCWNGYCLRGGFYCSDLVWAIYLSERHKSTLFGSNGYWFGNNSNKDSSLRSSQGFANLAVVGVPCWLSSFLWDPFYLIWLTVHFSRMRGGALAFF